MPEGDDDAEDLAFCKEELHGDTSAETGETAMDDKGDSEDVLDRDGLERSEDEKEGEDFWSLNGTCLVRHHVVPRTKLFSLYDVTSTKPPMPLEYIDIRRETYTNLENPGEAVIYDAWWLPADQAQQVDALRDQERTLSAPWTGKTMFNLLMNVPKPGYEWCEGEDIRCGGQTTRPGNITPYNWSQLSRAMRRKRKIAWDNLMILEKPLRDIRQRNVIPPEEADRYNIILADQIKRTKRRAAPAMPCIAISSLPPSSTSLPRSSGLLSAQVLPSSSCHDLHRLLG